MNPITMLFAVLLIGGVVVWLGQRSGRQSRDTDDVDGAILEEAEDEVRDLGTFTTPEETDDQLPDWGPGVPRDR